VTPKSFTSSHTQIQGISPLIQEELKISFFGQNEPEEDQTNETIILDASAEYTDDLD